jgi:hypothetical protein
VCYQAPVETDFAKAAAKAAATTVIQSFRGLEVTETSSRGSVEDRRSDDDGGGTGG